MLDQLHFGDKIGDLDQLFLRVAAGQHNMGHDRLLFPQEGQNVIDIKIIVAKCDVDFVEQDQTPGDPIASLKTSYEYLKTQFA